jgi:hypothetical protein
MGVAKPCAMSDWGLEPPYGVQLCQQNRDHSNVGFGACESTGAHAANFCFPPSQDLDTERSEWLLRGAGSKTATVRLAGAMRLSDKGGEDVS